MGTLSSDLWLQSLSFCHSWRDASSSSALLIAEQAFLSDDFLLKGTFVCCPLSELWLLVPVVFADHN